MCVFLEVIKRVLVVVVRQGVAAAVACCPARCVPSLAPRVATDWSTIVLILILTQKGSSGTGFKNVGQVSLSGKKKTTTCFD